MKIINNNNKNAFTLSEILVTLGIVGVIATLTLPNLMSSYTKKQQVARLQRTVNAVTSAAQNYLLDNQADTLDDTDFKNNHQLFLTKYLKARYIGDIDVALPGNYKKISKLDDSRIVKEMLNSSFGGNYGYSIYACGNLNSGTTVCISTPKMPDSENYAVVVDVNAKGKPNIHGRDLFTMNINQKGKIVPPVYYGSSRGGHEYEYEYGYEYGYGGRGGFGSCLEDVGHCYSQIVRDGWEMNY